MSDNPYRKTTWIFTFCVSSNNSGKCVRLYGTYSDARNKMSELFEDRWAYQYAESEWKRHSKLYKYLLETEISLEEAIKNDRKRVSKTCR